MLLLELKAIQGRGGLPPFPYFSNDILYKNYTIYGKII
jgi:hypothetical protein